MRGVAAEPRAETIARVVSIWLVGRIEQQFVGIPQSVQMSRAATPRCTPKTIAGSECYRVWQYNHGLRLLHARNLSGQIPNNQLSRSINHLTVNAELNHCARMTVI